MSTSVLDLSKCVPLRNPHSWEILEKRTPNEFRKNKQNKKLLPLSILVKIRGPPKLVDSYTKYVAPSPRPDKQDEINSSCTPVNLTPVRDGSKTKRDKPKKGALILRPALQQCKQIPGRYFPKPTLTDEQQKSLIASKENKVAENEKPNTSPSSSVSSKGKTLPRAASDITCRRYRGNFTNSVNPKIFHTRKTLFDREDRQLFSIGFRSPFSSIETQTDIQTIKRSNSFNRQVTFPEKMPGFKEMLKGTTKTLHDRKEVQSAPTADQTDTITDIKPVVDANQVDPITDTKPVSGVNEVDIKPVSGANQDDPIKDTKPVSEK